MKNLLIGFVLAIALALVGLGVRVTYVAAQRASAVFTYLSEPIAKTKDGKTITRADALAVAAAQAVKEK